MKYEKKEVLKYLLERREKWEQVVEHAIQNEYNPHADNGPKRLVEARKELERINDEIKELCK